MVFTNLCDPAPPVGAGPEDGFQPAKVMGRHPLVTLHYKRLPLSELKLITLPVALMEYAESWRNPRGK